MATATKKTVKKAAKASASVPAIAASKGKVAAKPSAKVVAKADSLVTNIVEVENKNSNNGVSKMTKETEKKAEKAAEKTAEAANSFFADVRERAETATVKGRELLEETGTFTKETLAAVSESGKIAVKGTQDLAKENIEYAKSNFSDAQAAVKSLTAVKSPTEFVQVQTEIARKGFDTMVSQGSKNTETMIKLASDIFQPISNRMAVATDLFKKAA